MKKILVTGGTGYLGSHTTIDLINNGFEVIVLDNLSRSSIKSIDQIEKITSVRPKFYQIDLTDATALASFFEKEQNIDGIIHFAAYKYVDESVQKPILYFKNNIQGLLNLMEEVEKHEIKYFVFSSSCSVYGNIDHLPVTESTPLNKTQSPYAKTKVLGELILEDIAQFQNKHIISLRYFNPVGAHESGEIGESPAIIPNNLVPRITGTAIGKFPMFKVYGHDLNTRDGSCIRDYIHVMDIASAHTKALQYLSENYTPSTHEIINLGSGKGVTVLEAIQSFEKISGLKLNYELDAPRDGDVVAIYSDSSHAKETLGWTALRTIDDMMRTAWEWEKKNNSNTSI